MTTIKLKNGSGAPTAGDLAQGEPALDLTNKRLYTEDSGGTVIEVGTNPTSVTTGDITATGTATFAGLTTTADVSFGDNDKAIFGAGSDLQIYHDGSHSRIDDAGTGALILRADYGLFVQKYSDNTAMLNVRTDGAVELMHNGSEKLATTATGIDVTGTAVTDGLTMASGSQATIGVFGTSGLQLIGTTGGDNVVGTMGASEPLIFRTVSAERMRIDSSGNVGIGTSSPSQKLHIEGSSHTRLQITSSTTTDAAIYLGDTADEDVGALVYDNAQNSMKFLTNAAERMRIDSSGNVGIGTSSPAAVLDIQTANAGSDIRLTATDGSSGASARFTTAAGNFYVGLDTASGGSFGAANHAVLWQDSAYGMTFATNNSRRMTIDSSGNVGIGTSSPATQLHVIGETRIDPSSGNARLRFSTSGTERAQIFAESGANLGFETGGSEAMRIDSSGNLLVGATSFDSSNTGHALPITHEAEQQFYF
jgi:hypothetical protein